MHSKSCGESLGNLMSEDLRDEISSPLPHGASNIGQAPRSRRCVPSAKKATCDDDFADEAHFVRHDQHGHALPREQADRIEDLRYEFWIECRRHLVKQQDFRLQSQRSGDSDALLLAP